MRARMLLRMRAEFVEARQTTALILRSTRAFARVRLEGWLQIRDVIYAAISSMHRPGGDLSRQPNLPTLSSAPADCEPDVMYGELRHQ
jgi:hypothetical protein